MLTFSIQQQNDLMLLHIKVWGFFFPYKIYKSNNSKRLIQYRELQVPSLFSKQIRSVQPPNTKDFAVFVVSKSVDNHKTPLGSN